MITHLTNYVVSQDAGTIVAKPAWLYPSWLSNKMSRGNTPFEYYFLRFIWHAAQALSLILFGSKTPVTQISTSSEIWVLKIDGIINPLTARYEPHQIKSAQPGSELHTIIIELNTPGGLETSMREMPRSILSSPIPTLLSLML